MEPIDASEAVISSLEALDLKDQKDLVNVPSDMFPVMKNPDGQVAAYKQVPLASLAALGTAFAQLPESARTVVQSVTKSIATNETLFVGINPKGISGYLTAKANGTVGNIMRINDQGKHVIAGRLRFKPIDGLPITETTSTVVPIDPVTMAIAVALVAVEHKLDGIQKSVEEVLQFLKLEKQSKQRGNLNMLAEIMEDYKNHCQNEKFCSTRDHTVLEIKKAAHQDILFYQEQVTTELQSQKGIHASKDSQKLLDAVSHQFAEYQLACHIYGFSTFLDTLLQKNFDTISLQNNAKKMLALATHYNALYMECRAQLANYQRSTLEAQIIGGIGKAAKGLGKAIASVPVIRDGQVDEALISASESIGKFNRDTLVKKMELFEGFESTKMDPFIESLQSINRFYNMENSMITDGTNLYLLESV